MPKMKNAKRKHFLAPWLPTAPSTEPGNDGGRGVGRGKNTAEAENDEETDDIAYYNGDGTKKTVVTSVKNGYSFEGDYIKEDEAQAIVAGMRFKTGDDRNVWLKVVESDGKTQYVGVATVSGIKIGGGEASEYEGFEATISWNAAPKQSAVVG